MTYAPPANQLDSVIMNSLYKKQILRLSALLIACLLTLTGCQTSSTPQYTLQFTASDYLQLANNSTGETQASYLLKASEALIADHQTYTAQSILNRIDVASLTPQQTVQLKLLQASTFITYSQYRTAQSKLNGISQLPALLTTAQQRLFHQLRAKIYKNQGNITAYVNEQMQ